MEPGFPLLAHTEAVWASSALDFENMRGTEFWLQRESRMYRLIPNADSAAPSGVVAVVIPSAVVTVAVAVVIPSTAVTVAVAVMVPSTAVTAALPPAVTVAVMAPTVTAAGVGSDPMGRCSRRRQRIRVRHGREKRSQSNRARQDGRRN